MIIPCLKKKKKKSLNELRSNFSKEQSRKKAHKLKAWSEIVLNIHFS